MKNPRKKEIPYSEIKYNKDKSPRQVFWEGFSLIGGCLACAVVLFCALIGAVKPAIITLGVAAVVLLIARMVGEKLCLAPLSSPPIFDIAEIMALFEEKAGVETAVNGLWNVKNDGRPIVDISYPSHVTLGSYMQGESKFQFRLEWPDEDLDYQYKDLTASLPFFVGTG